MRELRVSPEGCRNVFKFCFCPLLRFHRALWRLHRHRRLTLFVRLLREEEFANALWRTRNNCTKLNQLLQILENPISGANVTYVCEFADEHCIVFGPTSSKNRVMIPTDIALEWIHALELGLIDLKMTARQMRKIIADRSNWSSYNHGFETHLHAIIKAWAGQAEEI